MLYFILWYLIGLILVSWFIYFSYGDIIIQDIFLIIPAGLFGPFIIVFILIYTIDFSKVIILRKDK